MTPTTDHMISQAPSEDSRKFSSPPLCRNLQRRGTMKLAGRFVFAGSFSLPSAIFIHPTIIVVNSTQELVVVQHVSNLPAPS